VKIDAHEEGKFMAAARAIVEIEPKTLAWLTVEDNTGRVWRYRRVGEVDLAEPVDVEGHLKHGHPFRANLVRDNDGHPSLRQDGPGLPRVLMMEYIEDPSNLYLTALGLPGKAEYVLVE
jgi:hypothetical protein